MMKSDRCTFKKFNFCQYENKEQAAPKIVIDEANFTRVCSLLLGHRNVNIDYLKYVFLQ